MKPVEAPLTKALYSIATTKKIPISGTFELSPMCNFNCPMCYVRKTPVEVLAHPRSMLTLANWLSIAEAAREKGMLYLLLTGGEPLLWPDFWTLYEKMIEMGFLVSINTNGSLIDGTAIERFRRMPPSRINITLYGASDETYEALCQVKGVYTKVSNAILGLKDAGVTVKLNCSMTTHNIDDLEKMVDFARANQLILDATPYMYPPIRRDSSMIGRNDRFTPEEAGKYNLRRIYLQRGAEFFQEFLREIISGKTEPLGLDESCVDPVDGRIRCRAGKASFWITWDGYMTPCGMMPEPRAEISDGFDNAWERTVANSREISLSGLCSKCENHEICHACAAMALAETGDFKGIPIYLCEMVQEMKRIALNEFSS